MLQGFVLKGRAKRASSREHPDVVSCRSYQADYYSDALSSFSRVVVAVKVSAGIFAPVRYNMYYSCYTQPPLWTKQDGSSSSFFTLPLGVNRPMQVMITDSENPASSMNTISVAWVPMTMQTRRCTGV